MDLADALYSSCPIAEAARVDPLLNGNVRFGFKLKVALLRVVAVVIRQCPLDIHRMGVVALDQVAVVAIHGTDQIRQGLERALGEASTKACGVRRQIDR